MRKTKQVHFIRHAHGLHNEAGEFDRTQYLREDLFDANLTAFGEAQCQRVCENQTILQKVQGAEILVVSPMRRTLQTARLCFPNFRHIPWRAIEVAREQTGLHPCDKRSTIGTYTMEYPDIDFSEIEHDADPLFHRYSGREPDEHVDERAKVLLYWIRDRSESEMIIVTHSAFLRGLFNRVLPKMDDIHCDQIEPGVPFERFDNCELRTLILHYL
jgi:broad specificity phosphatase PhoE